MKTDTSARSKPARKKAARFSTPRLEPEVAAVFAAYPPDARRQLKALRTLIFATAHKTPETGPITETLKWGEPAYLTEVSKSGSTIRIGWKARSPDQVALYCNCRTSLVDTFRTLFPELRYEGNRAVVFDVRTPLPEAALRVMIEAALTYHSNKKSRIG